MLHIAKDRYTKFIIVWGALMTIWWLVLHAGTFSENQYLIFGAVYGTIITLFVSLFGFSTAKYWGGMKSIMGKAIFFLSAGVFAQFLGQLVFSFYNIILGVEVPYPSLADIGYFGNIPLYVLGIIYLAQASGLKLSLKSFGSKLQAVFIPIIMIAISYTLFLREYDFASSDLLTMVLDFGYPIGQGLYLSIALVTYSLSVKTLGGIMRSRIVFILAAFVMQYLADFNFLYQHLVGTWYNGGYGDYLYLIAYVFMGIGLFQLRVTAQALRAEEKK